jgi:type III secretion system YscD/HrpQ family protein
MQRFILKVLAGPNAGAEALLGERTVVGSAETDDIMIGEAALAPGHFTIEIKGDALNIVVGDTPLTIKSESKSQGRYALAPFDLIKFGSTVCAVGPEAAPWPAFAPADLLPPPPPTLAEAVAEAEVAPAPEAAEAAPEEAIAPPPSPAKPRRALLPWIAAACAALLLVLGGGYVLLGDSDDVVASPGAQAVAQEIVAAQGAKGVTIKGDDRGRLVAEGFVVTSEQQRRLRLALQAAGVPLRFRAVSLEQQTSAVRTLAGAAGARLTVEANPETGKLVLDGFLPEAATVDTLMRTLQRDIADLRPIESHIVTSETVRAEVAQRLKAAGLEGQTTIEVAGNVVRIKGSLAEDGRKAAAQLAEDLTSRWQGMARVENATTAIGATAPPVSAPTTTSVTVKASPPPAKFVIIAGGREAFVRDEAGRRYSVGDKLANGEVIEEIRVEEVITSRDGVRHRYTFGGGQ